MTYQRIFDPPSAGRPVATATVGPQGSPSLADREGHGGYVYSDEIVLAVNVALATGRPLLIRGPSGTGKSTLARSVATILRRRYYERVITSRTQAQDLLWRLDMLQRLQDAQAKQLERDLGRYVTPEVLWWAFDEASAQRQADETMPVPAAARQTRSKPLATSAVVLLDEIDKADPDVPNNLLVPLGSMRFQVEPLGVTVKSEEMPLVCITTNEERELPPAFLRRCVELKLRPPEKPEQLVAIGRSHFPGADAAALVESVADLVFKQAGPNPSSSPVSFAEYLDAVRACMKLRVLPGSKDWDDISRATLWKHGRQVASP